MNDDFELPVVYKGEELQLPARFFQFGYSYRIEVDIYGSILLFEADEERNWRALAGPGFIDSGKKVDVELIKAITEVLESITR